ncbi:uncharacterized protein LOC122638658 [Telopea speciosissima]|uniref:uncharacterized protein LOC122638658 n=1 Tax=Telopea speciosissima TaxID=54955 RepID=UPI001CC7002E|nr:uncharacterized protein LOC122638658 [Telopea speciosissima]
MCSNRVFKFSTEKESFPFLFSVVGEEWPESFYSTDSGHRRYTDDTGDETEQDDNANSVQESQVFWETQHQLLDEIFSGTSSTESTILQATEEAIRKSQMAGNVCVCWRYIDTAGGCLNCLRRDVSGHLRSEGFDCAICVSMWSSSSEIPSGMHSYLDVVDKSEEEEEVRVVIELNFRAEFEMARASNEYKRLINRIPEIFVGKEERLSSLVEILCLATKKCMKENKMHMGPWRKHKYMQAKWFGTCEVEDTIATSSATQTSYGLRVNI